jgi:predicted Zn-dependent peptidase
LQRPRFELGELEIVRTRRIEFIKAAKDSEPQSVIGHYGRALLFADHPYGKPVSGSEASLAALTRAQVLGFYRDHFGADRLTLVFAGDFDPDWMLAAVTAAFGPWSVAREPLPTLCAPGRAEGRNVLLVDAPDSTQTYFWIGNTGVARSYPQRAALEVTNTAFGGSFGSMLMQALRVKSGLTYSVSSHFRRGSVAAEFAISSFTSAQSTGEALDIALQTLSTLKRDGAGDEALASARNYIRGQYPLGFETAADWASALAELDLYGLPETYIEEFAHSLQGVDAALSQRVVEDAYPNAADVDIVLIGDAARIRAAAGRLGPVREKPLAAPDFYAPAA